MNEFAIGDTFKFKFEITDVNKQVIPQEEIETLFITVKLEPNRYKPVIFQKKLDDIIFEDGFYHVTFEPKDTETLSERMYYFDIEVTLKNGYRKTLLDTFTLTKETTTHGDEDE